jgi:hypothetical protein
MSLPRIGESIPEFELDAMVSVKVGGEITRIHKGDLAGGGSWCSYSQWILLLSAQWRL